MVANAFGADIDSHMLLEDEMSNEDNGADAKE